MKKFTKLSLLSLAIAVSSSVFAAPKTFVYCLESLPTYLNPQFATDGGTFDATSRAIFNRLVDFAQGETAIVPSLAEKWNVSEDGKSYTFYLRKGVKFHATKDFKPSRDFNADDVLFSFNRQLDPNHPFHKVSGGNYEYFIGMDMGNIIQNVEKVDDYTVKINLKVPNARRMAELIQEDWKKVGVNVKIVSYEWGEYLNRMRNGEHAAGMMGWSGDNGDPDNFLNILLSCTAVKQGSNYAKFCHKDFDKLMTDAVQTTDKAKRTELYKQAQVLFKEQAPWITIAHSTTYFPVRKEVKGYVISPFSLHNFYGVDLEAK